MTGGASRNHRSIFNPSSAVEALSEVCVPCRPMPSRGRPRPQALLSGFLLRRLLSCRLTNGLLGCLLGGRFLALRCCFSHWNSLPLEFESARTNKTCASSRNLLTKKFHSDEKNWLLISFCCANAAIFLFLDPVISIEQTYRRELMCLICVSFASNSICHPAFSTVIVIANLVRFNIP